MQSRPRWRWMMSRSRAKAAIRGPARSDITGAEYWSGACAGATVWLIFILYAASRGLG